MDLRQPLVGGDKACPTASAILRVYKTSIRTELVPRRSTPTPVARIEHVCIGHRQPRAGQHLLARQLSTEWAEPQWFSRMRRGHDCFSGSGRECLQSASHKPLGQRHFVSIVGQRLSLPERLIDHATNRLLVHGVANK